MIKSDDCTACAGGSMEEVRLESFVYSASALGPFRVSNARVLRCRACGRVRYANSQAKAWEFMKALELVSTKRAFRGREVRFLRHLFQCTGTEFGHRLGVGKGTISKWESGKIRIQAQRSLQNFVAATLIAPLLSSVLEKETGHMEWRDELRRRLSTFEASVTLNVETPESIAKELDVRQWASR